MLMRFRFLLLFCSLSIPLLAQQAYYTVATVPNPKTTGSGYVSDPDDILTRGEQDRLNRIIAELEDSTTAQVAVVLLNSIGDASPKEFATELFNTWGIGQADKDNGLLVFTVMDQRRTEFETGYGLEGVLPDLICYRIGMQELVPYFKQGQYGDGLTAALLAFQRVLEDPAAAEEIRSSGRGNGPLGNSENAPLWMALSIYAIINLLVNVYVLSRIRQIIRAREELYDKYLDLKKWDQWWLVLLFPLPFIFIFLFIKKRLKALRDEPRFSRYTGSPMRRLSEKEEDDYLERGQIIEEEIGSVDYDVWVSESDPNDILVLRYARRYTKYSSCRSCGYKTFYHAQTVVLRHATYSSTGQKEVIRKCKNCNYVDRRYVTIPRKQRSSSSSGGSSGGGSWGGGSSGGGGAGVSW